MIEFDLWRESFIFALVYSVMIIVPCVLIALLGRSMIEKLGRYPTRTPVIQMGVFFQKSKQRSDYIWNSHGLIS